MYYLVKVDWGDVGGFKGCLNGCSTVNFDDNTIAIDANETV